MPATAGGIPNAADIRVFVERVVITGNTVFSAAELEPVTTPFTGRVLTTEDLDALRQALTVFYIGRGYINSGAVIPDQRIENNTVRVHIIEGHLTAVEVEGNRWFRDGFIGRPFLAHADRPLEISALQERLRMLMQDELIDRVHGSLKPGSVPGESVLHLEVEERQPIIVELGYDNYQSPSVGARHGWLSAAHRNLSGHGDVLRCVYGTSEGTSPQIDISYTLPFTTSGTAVTLRYRRNDFDVVEEPFDPLDVESESEIFQLGISQPLYRRPTGEFSLSLYGERLRHQTSLLGEPFSFSSGSEDGRAVVTALRCAQEWTYHTQREVIAARSRFSCGLNALGATIHGGDSPDGRFASWLGQFQWARVLTAWDIQVILRADLQLADKSLLPLEQFAVGGRYSVRGYRENQLVRDQGFITSLESRIFLARNTRWADYLQLAPFFDYGRAWNRDLPTPAVKHIAGAGLGLRWGATWEIAGRTLKPRLEVYWGVPLRRLSTPEHDLQDNGIHLQFALAGF
ncbi:MAG: ShlB/FhaC/HecB family hemolysin secretion/activation protein [Deltaproteobacteria bacterium]|nr:ShlB/FhaC/HecB family hemolysin secretion/activation protein [Candidatus Anaeroferrophillacea bacterium]